MTDNGSRKASSLVHSAARAYAIVVGLTLTLFLLTCTDPSLTAPRGFGTAALDFAAWTTLVAGDPPVPVESLQITLQRPADQSIALDTTFGFRPDTLKSDSADIRLTVLMHQSTESFVLTVRAFGGGFDWYRAAASIQMTAGATVGSSLLVSYVGPGVNAASIKMLPTDTTAEGGVPFPLHAAVYDGSGSAISGVPVGYRLSDSTRGSIVYPTPYMAIFTGATGLRGPGSRAARYHRAHGGG